MKRFILLFVCFLLTIPCTAEIITVDDNGPADFDNIQSAINDSNDGDIVEVKPGTYTGDGNRDIDFGGRAITVRSTDPNDPDIVAATIIDCNGTETDLHRGFYFHNGEDINSVVEGLTIKNGCAFRGGAIRCISSSPTINRCIIHDNEAVTSVMWLGEGGAIQGEESRMVINNCCFWDNTSSGGGGAICCYSYFGTGKISVLNCVFGRNQARTGGAIKCYKDNISLSNCVVVDNSGGIYCSKISPTISNCTFSGNSAGGGRGIYGFASNVTVINTILWGKTALERPEIKLQSSSLTISYSDVQGGEAAVHVDSACTLNWGPGNIDTDPCFVREGYWDFNEPWTFSEGDYHLKSEGWRWDSMRGRWDYDYVTSLCIDAGNPGSPLADEPLSIPDDPNNVYGKNIRINMGAYGGTAEASMPPLDWYSIADLTNDWAVDFNDLAVFVDYWLDTGRCIPSDLNRSRSVDFTDFAIFSRQWLDTPPAGPGVTYQIDDCDPETERGLDVADQSGELRFSVTVRDSYIYFEDMMAANCCPDALGLEMTVADSLITIYETEYTPQPCRCICDYPVTATLGPFEPGVYILEVYEDLGGFIGSTIVAIE